MQFEKPSGEGLDLNVALDAVFRRNVQARRDAVALVDPPDRAAFTDGLARRLSYAGADVAVGRLAQQLRGLGLPPGTVVAIQLPNVVEAAIALLAIERAGLVAAPVPLSWRKADLVRALGPIGAAAILTVARVGDERPAAVACAAAVELFSLSFPCAFGNDLPDGVMALDIDTDSAVGVEPPVEAKRDDIPSLLTFDAAPSGSFAVGRTHAEWVAAGLSTLMAARIAPHAEIVSALPLASLAGIGAAFIPWLLTGGTLQLVHGFAPRALERANFAHAHLVAPARGLGALLRDCGREFLSLIAVHRGLAAPFDLHSHRGAVVDVHAFGEIGAVVRRREERQRREPIPIGRVASAGGAAPPVGIETRIDADGVLALRGAMVPHRPFEPGGEALAIGADGFVRTGYRCRAENAFGLVVEAEPAGIASVGGLRFGLDDLAARIKEVAKDAVIAYIPDPVLGGRLVIETDDRAAVQRQLEAAGLAQIILDAVVPRTQARRMAG